MSLPKRVSIGPGNNEVGIIGRREAHQFLPFRFIGIDRDNVAPFLSRNAFPYAVNNQRANQRWRALKDRQTEIGDASVTTVIGRDFFTPNLAYFAALLREAHDEYKELLAAGPRKNNFGVVQRFGFGRRDRLCRGQCGDENEQ